MGTYFHKHVTVFQERCDCGDQIRHNNGGNYHRIERLHMLLFTSGHWCAVLERTTTREGFPGDQYESLIPDSSNLYEGGWGELILEPTDRIPEAKRFNAIEAARFRWGEAQILAQGHYDADE